MDTSLSVHTSVSLTSESCFAFFFTSAEIFVGGRAICPRDQITRVAPRSTRLTFLYFRYQYSNGLSIGTPFDGRHLDLRQNTRQDVAKLND